MRYQTVTAYFLSGTGNAYRVATWWGEAAAGRAVAACIKPLALAKPEEEVGVGPEHLLALVLPAHGFTAPWTMIRFVLRLPQGKGTHASVMVTRAGTKFGPLFAPGMEGTAGWLLALILFCKGYSVRGVRGVDMPFNWMFAYWGMREDNARAIINRNRPRVMKSMEQILDGKRSLGGFFSLLLGLVLVQVSLVYLVFARFALAKVFFASNRCNGCGECARNCPVQALRMEGAARPRPYWTFGCESCMRCMGFCPQQAIEASQPLIVLMYYFSVPCGAVLLAWLTAQLPALKGLGSWPAILVLAVPYSFLVYWLTHRVVSWLIRIPVLNVLLTCTTLTHWYRRYREPDVAAGELKCGKGRTQGAAGPAASTTCP
ncbi:MAG: EFR1 family ferrodoxin [Planctomycetota bacterium]